MTSFLCSLTSQHKYFGTCHISHLHGMNGLLVEKTIFLLSVTIIELSSFHDQCKRDFGCVTDHNEKVILRGVIKLGFRMECLEYCWREYDIWAM